MAVHKHRYGWFLLGIRFEPHPNRVPFANGTPKSRPVVLPMGRAVLILEVGMWQISGFTFVGSTEECERSTLKEQGKLVGGIHKKGFQTKIIDQPKRQGKVLSGAPLSTHKDP